MLFHVVPSVFLSIVIQITAYFKESDWLLKNFQSENGSRSCHGEQNRGCHVKEHKKNFVRNRCQQQVSNKWPCTCILFGANKTNSLGMSLIRIVGHFTNFKVMWKISAIIDILTLWWLMRTKLAEYFICVSCHRFCSPWKQIRGLPECFSNDGIVRLLGDGWFSSCVKGWEVPS